LFQFHQCSRVIFHDRKYYRLYVLESRRYPLKAITNKVVEHSPLKNITHINGGERSSTSWITFSDISFQGVSYNGIFPRSNHRKYINTAGPMGTYKEDACAGTNVLHIGGNVTWHGEKQMNIRDVKNEAKLLGLQIATASGGGPTGLVEKTSWWLFPRTE
ncbi:MAG: hypothetical protein ABIG61_05940, partial [Planctomycetota bacterium]